MLIVLVLYPVLEWITASWLAAIIGWGWVIVLVTALVFLGSLVMRRAGVSAATTLRDGTRAGQQAPAAGTGTAVGDASLLFVAGVLIALPGLVTSAIGLLMLIRPIRRVLGLGIIVLVTRRLSRSGYSLMSTFAADGTKVTRVVPGDVVQGEVIRDVRRDDRPPNQPPAALPD